MNLLRNYLQNDELEIFGLDRCVIAVWKVPPSIDGIVVFERIFEDLKREFSEGLCLINIAPGGGKRGISPEAKARLYTMQQNTKEFILATAHIILARGVVGAVIRSLLTTVNLLQGASASMKVFRDTDDAASWLGSRVDIDVPGLKVALTKILSGDTSSSRYQASQQSL